MFLKIKYKLKELFAKLLIKASLFLNWPQLTSVGFWLASSKLNLKCKSEYTVLCLGRSVFIEDMKAMAIFSGRIKYIVIWRNYFQIILYHFLTASEKEELNENNYYTRNIGNEGKRKYYLYLKKVLPFLRKLMKIDAFLAGSFCYVEQQELAKLCEDEKFPMIVLYRENFGVPHHFEEKRINMFKCWRFYGAKILLCSDKIKNQFLDIDMFGLLPENMAVVGIPRLDFYFKKDRIPNVCKQIVFFSFTPEKFQWFADNEETREELKKRSVDFHKWIMNFAARHKDIKVIIKTKFPKEQWQYVQDIFEANFHKKMDNLIIVNQGNNVDFINDSMAVIGFNSTTLIEALIADKIIISPYFFDVPSKRSWAYFGEDWGLINYAKTERELEQHILNKGKASDDYRARRDIFLRQLISNPDGHSGIRAEESIIETIRLYYDNK